MRAAATGTRASVAARTPPRHAKPSWSPGPSGAPPAAAAPYLDCGLLCRGFARLRCERCEESRLVAFSCKGRGFCPSCLGRRICATAANLIEDVLPEVAHRPWVLTFPLPWRRRLAQDGALFGVLTRIFVESVERFYEERAARRALAPHICDRCPRVPNLQGADEARRHDH
ncbi:MULTISPECIES: transposase zinc-binding domain-containing protein [Sorangium]|uniref:Transposase zinc-binding domain-containing protein n=1 Tax=Sorangium cellulosum TaxID=56 RepID=A0A4P2QHE7_SORCE|nr:MULTISPECIES: transposase zinc-binding domain-containing protein [Sorangium]AUX29006.1 uncharacterized protein SOCE836_010910 [Sorangium cellulosum]